MQNSTVIVMIPVLFPVLHHVLYDLVDYFNKPKPARGSAYKACSWMSDRVMVVNRVESPVHFLWAFAYIFH